MTENIEQADLEKLAEMKLWLFQENVRIETEKKMLTEKQDAFSKESQIVKQQFKEESRKLEFKRKQLEREKKLFDEKWSILKAGYERLENDRRAFHDSVRREKAERHYQSACSASYDSSAPVFFNGIKDMFSLKKRYRELMKVFHPDNVMGDKETLQRINLEYEAMRDKLKHQRDIL